MSGRTSICGFCGADRLFEMGNDRGEYLHSAVRVGEAPNWTYETHPNAWEGDEQYVSWCGVCLRGLAHKYQRLDDLNLGAKLHAWQLWKELDGIRWHAGWESEADALDVGRQDGSQFDPSRPYEEGRELSRRFKDDTATHLDKLTREEEIRQMEAEQRRRWNLVGGSRERLLIEGWRE